MENVKTTKEFKIFKKRNGRYAVKTLKGKTVNGADKIAVLSKEGLIKLTPPKKVEEAAAAE